MSVSSELSGCSAVELMRRIKAREISPVELVENVVAVTEARNPTLNAMVVFGFDEALERARTLERALMRGDIAGPLHGLPVAMKDCGESKRGWVNTYGGIRAFRNRIADADTIFPERMEAAGAIVIGKTNAPSFGFRAVTDNYLFGPTRNPFNVTKNAGGSSGGSAAIVADGILPLAEGTDGGGSVRIPASWCGIYGYKPSFGRIPAIFRPNAFMGTTPFLFEGSLTRTVKDAALALSVLNGYDHRDPFSIESIFDAGRAVQRSIAGWKIAYSPDFGIYPVDPEVRRVTEQSLIALEDAGAHIEEVSFAIRYSHKELSDVLLRLLAQNMLGALDELARLGVDLLKDYPEDLPPEIHHWCEIAGARTARDYIRDQMVRSELYDAVDDVLGTYQLLATPTLACLPVNNAADGNTNGPSEINGAVVDPIIGWCLTYPVNFTGHPAASVPAGLSRDGLPVGLQLIGRRYADEDVLAASAEIERYRPWADAYRICADRPLVRN